MQKANLILQALRKLGETQQPLTRVYRNLYCEELYLAAYAKLTRNQGALTAGVDGDTVDGMSLDRIRHIIEAMRYERYRFRPVRRIHIPKASGGTRPLGLPTFSDKLVQEVLRQMLDAYYEPRFRNSSHGFRAGRGCHTALARIKESFQGAAWFIEGDIRGCFDNLNHAVLMGILARDIHDQRLLNLIRGSLEAGILEAWRYQQTYSGVPQGGVLSPLLSNIYLHELDVFVEEALLPHYNRGKERVHNLPYKRYEYRIKQARARGDHDEAQRLRQERRRFPTRDPKDPAFRRLHYVRYADDFILGFSGPKAEAETIKATIGAFLRDTLQLEMSSDKTLLTHARTQQAHFLGYTLSLYHNNDVLSRTEGDTRKDMRSINGHVRLGMPQGLPAHYAKRYQRHGKTVSEPALLEFSDAHIIEVYQQRFRGIAEYYKYAVDRHCLTDLRRVMQEALVKTLAHKYRISVRQVYRKYRGTRTVNGYPYKTLQVEVPTARGSRLFYWGAIPLRVVKPGSESITDTMYRDHYMRARSDVVQRLQASTCELCGSQEQCEVHHVRKLADLTKPGRKSKPDWVRRMVAMRRKTLVVCRTCHMAIHAGKGLTHDRK